MSTRKYYKKLTLEEMESLGKRCSEGDVAAREVLILSHIYLVEQIVPFYRGEGVADEDLFQEGCYGLIEAVDRYDYTKGIRLSTYAAHWIRKRMGLAIISQNMKCPINIPSDKIFYALRRFARCRLDLTEAFGRQPSTEELAEALDVPVEKVEKIHKFVFFFTPIDIDSREEGARTPKVVPALPSAPSAEEEAFDHFFRTELPVPVAKLTMRQREILSRRCGFTPTGEPETIESVAAALHVSVETVRIDYNAALNALRKAFEADPEQIYD